MKILNMSEKRFNSLEPFELPRDVLSTEAKLFVFEDKNRWKKEMKMLKKLHNDSGTLFSNKLYTVNELIDKSEEIDIEELVLPEKLVSIYGKIVGFTMPLIDNVNLKTVFNSMEFSNKQKIEFLKEIGEILEKMRKLREYSSVHEFYLNDLHENNFILNKQTGRINVIDIDSCKIGHNLPFPSRFLTNKSPINEIAKYKKISTAIKGANILPDENTDIFCYILTILNYMSGMNLNNFTIGEYYDYLSYLGELGISDELLDIFSLVYTDKDNVNPYEYIDELANVVGRSHYNVYKLKRKK